jgi:hypothetical protein
VRFERSVDETGIASVGAHVTANYPTGLKIILLGWVRLSTECLNRVGEYQTLSAKTAFSRGSWVPGLQWD